MIIKVADLIVDFLFKHGVEHVFTVTGGGAMHLNNAFGQEEQMTCIYNHHEQACAIGAEGYARLTGKVAAVCVTSGPGGINALTGVLGAWQDSVPMFVISGQVKRETTTIYTDASVRQLGDQEFQIADVAGKMTKYAVMVTEPSEILYHLEKAWILCTSGRRGPVWLDIPLDIQAAKVETDELLHFSLNSPYEESRESIKTSSYVTKDESITWSDDHPVLKQEDLSKIQEALKTARKPAVLLGTGVRLSDAGEQAIKLIEKWKVPVLTAWNAHDLIWDDFPYYCGRPGTVGLRGGNYVLSNCDMLLVLGCRLNIRMIGYNFKEFASQAYKIMVDIDKNELCKPTIRTELPVHADLRDVVAALLQEDSCIPGAMMKEWLSWSRDIHFRYPACEEKSRMAAQLDQYAFTDRLSDFLENEDAIVCGNGGACVVTFQALKIKKGQRLFTNSGCAAMGYGFPAAIGCAAFRSSKKEGRVICIDGDGSLQMNIQELQTLQYHRYDLKLIVINNNGYHSIRQTQRNLFQAHYVGIDSKCGISFPDFEKIAVAYDINFYRIQTLEDMNEAFREFLQKKGPGIIEVIVDENKNFEPKLSSKVLPDGTMVSPRLDDMYPFLNREEHEKNHFYA